MIKLDEVLEEHQKWLNDNEEGSRGDLRGAHLKGANLRGANLRGANLRGADLMGADLMGADLMDANLRDANLMGANLMGANLRGADLSGANLMDANLSGADLRYTDLMDANLMGANLYGVVGNMGKIKSIFVDTYLIAYTSEVIQIGCERHTISEWFNFDDARILEMDGRKALTFWRKWKPILQSIIEE